MLGITRSILGTVGNTPVVRIDCIAPAGIELFGRRETNGVAFDRSGNDDAHSFLPKRLHPRSERTSKCRNLDS